MGRRTGAAVALILFVMAGVPAVAQQKVIMDTDFNTIGDDGQTLVMAAQLDKAGVIDLLGVTLVTGNNWLAQEAADALRAVERLGIADRIGVYGGANLPLVHDPRSFAAERDLFGEGETWLTAFHRPEPTDADLVAPPDGFAQEAQLQPETAGDSRRQPSTSSSTASRPTRARCRYLRSDRSPTSPLRYASTPKSSQ